MQIDWLSEPRALRAWVKKEQLSAAAKEFIETALEHELVPEVMTFTLTAEYEETGDIQVLLWAG